jgi:hypothetical protein
MLKVAWHGIVRLLGRCSNHVPTEISTHAYVTSSLTIKTLNNYLMFSRHYAACPAYNSRPTPVKWKMNYGTYSEL